MESLQILYLLADLFDLGLHVDDEMGDLRVPGLRADGIGLPVDLLHEEVQLSPGGLIRIHDLREGLEMGIQPDELLVDGGPVRVDGGFGEDPLLGCLGVEVLDAMSESMDEIKSN